VNSPTGRVRRQSVEDLSLVLVDHQGCAFHRKDSCTPGDTVPRRGGGQSEPGVA
jgi:hypothetical protein